MRQGRNNKGRPMPNSLFAALLYLMMFAIYLGNAHSAFTMAGITDLLNNTVVLALAASGLTIVILAAELDLSSVGVIAVANVVVATVSAKLPAGAFVSLILVCLVGLLVGLINGWLIAYAGLQSLATTLGTMIICQGIALLILEAPGGEVAEFITNRLTDTIVGVVPVAALIVALIVRSRNRLCCGTADGYQCKMDEISGICVSGRCLWLGRLHAERANRDRRPEDR
jgi:ribose transport system permease protein